MTALALSVLAASLLGSLHCAGMCGGFVAFYSGADARRDRWAVAGHVGYSAGRLLAYLALGALAGALGAALDLAGSLVGVQRSAAAIAGALIVLWGSATLLQILGLRAARLQAPPALRGLIARAMRSIASQPPPLRAFVIGLLAALLPCGWLYAFVVTAAGTGGPVPGAALMGVFWLGTLPVMMTLGLGLAALAGPVRRYLPGACAVAMIVVGLLAVADRMRFIEAPPAASVVTSSPTAGGQGDESDRSPKGSHGRH